MLRTGDEFAHYRIESLLGQGGMGQVYQAFDTKLHRRVALKLLLASQATSPDQKQDAVARIIREARAAAAVEHPNKVSIFELGEVDGTPYLAMEYIAGSTLRSFVGDTTVSWQQKLGWLVDVARALEAAHGAGLVHRDIKPENVMVREDGIVKVLDFGIARRADTAVDASAPTAAPSIEALTGKGVVIGTAAYMPPEQMHGLELDGRADQFAWGVMAFELIAGKHPWATGKDGLALIGAMLTTVAPPLAGVPDVVADAVARALRAASDERFPKMGDIAALLSPLTASSGPIAPGPTDRDSPDRPAVNTGMARTAKADLSLSASTAIEARRPGWRRRSFAVAGAALVLLLALVAAWRIRSTAEPPPATASVAYCRELVTTSSGPRCLVIVAPASLAQRQWTYKLTSNAQGVTEIERLNSAGLALGRNHHGVRIQIVRGPDGAVSEIITHNQHGEEVEHERWSEGGARIDYVEADGKTPKHWEESRVTAARREFDANGFVSRELYFGPTGKPRPSQQGVFGRKLQRSGDGFVLHETFLGSDGEPMANGKGVATTTHVQNEQGVDVETQTADIDGKPLLVDGVYTIRFAYNEGLDCASATFFDEGGARTVNLSYGTSGLLIDRDESGRIIKRTTVDDNGKPRVIRGESYASYDQVMDDRGREIRVTTYDASGNPVIDNEDGAAIWRYVWNDRDELIERHSMDPDGRPMSCRWGYARRDDIRDTRGRLIEMRHFDESGKLAPWMEGPAINKQTHDDRGLLAVSSLFDAESRPALHAQGIASSRTKYDGLRNRIELGFFGVDGKPVLNDEGVSVARYRFDEDDNFTELSRLDTAGALTNPGDFAVERLKSDDRGFTTEVSYFDSNENPVLTKEGFSSVRYARDRSGDVIEESYWGPRSEPFVAVGGYARKKHSYDGRRRRVETTLHDVNGALMVGSEGWAIERIGYDARSMIVRESHFDAQAKPALTSAGAATVATVYDPRGNVIERRTLGTDDKAVVTAEGFAIKKSTYNERDLLIEEALYGADGSSVVGKKGWSLRKLRYDDLYNLVDESFFDAERNPIAAKDPAYARKRDKYDARRRMIETAYFGETGAPAKGPLGVETIRYVRDAYGRATETAYFDAVAAPTLSTDGKMIVRSKYDDVGRLVEAAYVDASGKPLDATSGCSGYRAKYDDLGRIIEEACVGISGGLAVSKQGWALKRLLRDARGRVVEETTYGADAKPLADATGIFRKRHRYDDRGNLQETSFWSADDKPAKDKRGVATLRYRYDLAGKQVEETAVDEKGRRVAIDGPAPKAARPN